MGRGGGRDHGPHRAGPGGDEDAVRWIAVRHADDHVHIVATLARTDGVRPEVWNDGYRIRDACRAMEKRFGLRSTAPVFSLVPRRQIPQGRHQDPGRPAGLLRLPGRTLVACALHRSHRIDLHHRPASQRHQRTRLASGRPGRGLQTHRVCPSPMVRRQRTPTSSSSSAPEPELSAASQSNACRTARHDRPPGTPPALP